MSFILMAPQIFYWCINDTIESKETFLVKMYATCRIVKTTVKCRILSKYIFLINISIALLKEFLLWKKHIICKLEV